MTNRLLLLSAIIHKNPGIHFCEVIRLSGIKNGTLSHYIKKLESNGTIKIEREKKKTRFFSPQISNNEKRIIPYLRKKTSRDIIFLLMKNNGIEFGTIVRLTKKSPPTISQNISQLMTESLITFKIKTSKKFFYIKQKKLIENLMKKFDF